MPKPSITRRRGRRIPKQWRRGIALGLRYRPPTWSPSVWTRVRRAIWVWWPWLGASMALAVAERWAWATAAASVALLCYLLTPAESSPYYALDHEFGVDSDEFLATVTGATGVPFLDGNRLTILNNGDEFYPAMLDAIDTAEASISIEAYIYWAGGIGLQMAEHLAARAQAGVSVKILLDAVGSSSIGSDILTTLERGGCQLAWYNALRWYSIGRFNHRTHRKSLVIDGRVGFTGGAGIAEHWTGHAQSPEHWRDVQIRIEGPAVGALQTGFAQNWLQTTGELVTGSVYYPHFEERQGIRLQTVMSSPETGASAVRILYYLSIVSARRSILIANPYFVPDDAGVQALVAASRRGVSVRILVAGVWSDNWLARQNSVRLYGKLLREGIEILEYNRTMLHQKVMVVDGLWATIGTTNFDSRSFAHNEESNVSFHERELVMQLQRDFERDAAVADRVDLEAWRHRGIVARARELLAAQLQDQV